MPATEARTEEGAPTVVPVALNVTNMTRVEWVLTWNDDTANTDQDEISISITPPGGVAKEASNADGEISLVFEGLNLVPEAIRLQGSDASTAEARARELYTTTGGAGDWNVTITIVSTGNAVEPTGPAAGLPIPRDSGNEWTLTPRVTTYRAQTTPA
jgi:hypothetical protein